MYHPWQEILKMGRFVGKQVNDIVQIFNVKLVIFACLAVLLSPLIVLIYLTSGFLKCCSLLLPLLALVIIVSIGLPILLISKAAYGLFCLTHSVFEHIFKGIRSGMPF